jgi:Uma2 family endonuclease
MPIEAAMTHTVDMPAGTQISVEEYLKTVYRPDRDYLDGVTQERNFGDLDHSWVQSNIIAFFGSRFRETGIAALPEWRFQVRPTRFRIPDVVVLRGKPDEQILTKPPLLCIEILSPEDTVSRTNARIQDYLEFGVPVVWVVDPRERTVWIYRPTGMEQAVGLSVKLDGTSIEVPFSEIFD